MPLRIEPTGAGVLVVRASGQPALRLSWEVAAVALPLGLPGTPPVYQYAPLRLRGVALRLRGADLQFRSAQA
jgi:hypothetical protein